MQGKKATREQRKFIQKFDIGNVLVLKDTRHHNGKMIVITKAGEIKELCKQE